MKGNLIYEYPRVQYKVIKGSGLIIGFNEGRQIIENVFHDLKALNLNGNWMKIPTKALEIYQAPFSIANEQILYSFVSPWLASNESNYQLYKNLSIHHERKKLLEKILVGNILSISKSLGYTVAEPIKARIVRIRQIRTTFKSTPMIGFLGSFLVNFEIPDYWGIGKSVSRGFGTVVRQRTDNRG